MSGKATCNICLPKRRKLSTDSRARLSELETLRNKNVSLQRENALLVSENTRQTLEIARLEELRNEARASLCWGGGTKNDPPSNMALGSVLTKQPDITEQCDILIPQALRPCDHEPTGSVALSSWRVGKRQREPSDSPHDRDLSEPLREAHLQLIQHLHQQHLKDLAQRMQPIT